MFKVTKIVSNIEKYATPICPLQIYVGNNHRNFYLDLLNCSLILSNNTEMISKILPNDIISYINNKCNWLGGTVFQKIDADVHMTYHKVISISNTYINTTTERLIPLSVCPCLSNTSYNCYTANVYAVYPGQVLHINLMISSRWSEISSTIMVANTKDDDCSILDSYVPIVTDTH